MQGTSNSETRYLCTSVGSYIVKCSFLPYLLLSNKAKCNPMVQAVAAVTAMM
jgi:hypothetical protein